MFDVNLAAKHLQAMSKGRRVNTLISRYGIKPEALISELHAAIEFVEGGMQPGVRYFAKDLVGLDCWASYPIGVRLAAGICVSHMVARGDLPLSLASREGACPRRYQLRDGVRP